ncbi:uncharacterized protein LOC141853131 [Brevipalpus obovatus]|uniref:uncharacterized protein LOC141853131 n=1 Tax=Brevipalpus obovatus TaxID=246614 RepID=UPI003D9E39A1
MKTIIIVALFVSMLACVHGMTINSTSTTRPNIGNLEHQRDSLRRQIMESLDRIDQLMSRIRTTSNTGTQLAVERQTTMSPITVMNESINEVTKSVTNGLNVMRMQMNRLMAASPACNNPFPPL